MVVVCCFVMTVVRGGLGNIYHCVSRREDFPFSKWNGHCERKEAVELVVYINAPAVDTSLSRSKQQHSSCVGNSD